MPTRRRWGRAAAFLLGPVGYAACGLVGEGLLIAAGLLFVAMLFGEEGFLAVPAVWLWCGLRYDSFTRDLNS